jgi:hypothetical protein
MRAPIASRRRVLRCIVIGLGLVFAQACGTTTGCSGCSTTTITFPQAYRFDNAMQVRLSSTGIDFMEKNFSTLVTTLVPTGLSFNIPATGCGSADQQICCKTTTCTAKMAITDVTITPTPASTAALSLRASVSTTKFDFTMKILGIPITCDVQYDTSWSGSSTLGLDADMDLTVDASNNNKLEISRGSTTLSDFESGDISISGGFQCTIADWLKSFFKSMIEDQITKVLDDTLDSMLTSLPLGQEGRFDLSSVFAAFSPHTTGKMDYFLWAGGYAQAESSGMSVGVMGGFRAAAKSSCVPDCEASGAKCSPPQKAAISRSTSFRGNTRPDGNTFDVGIGVHKSALEQAGYALYSSGGLCLDITSSTFGSLNSALFGILVPSIGTLTGGQSMAMMLSTRPRNPPTVTLGKGTYKKDSTGKITIEEPLLKIKAKGFAIDVFVTLDERPVRIFTIVGDLEIPMLLYADSKGDLQPIVGALDSALTGLSVENADLLTTTDQASVKKLFPTLLSLAGTFLGNGFSPITLPSLSGVSLSLDSGSITTTDSYSILAIFANLALSSTTSLLLTPQAKKLATVETTGVVEHLELPATSEFRVDERFDPFGGPAVTLSLGAKAPRGLEGERVEYAVRVDGGFLRPFTTASRVVVQDPVFWIQGKHLVEVVARVEGRPATLDATPVRIPVYIDTVAPTGKLVPTATGVRAEVSDIGTPEAELELAWSVGGAGFGTYGTSRSVAAGAGTRVAVRVRDRAGHVTELTTDDLSSPPEAAAESGGCAIAADATALTAYLPLLIALVALVLRRRREDRA